MALEEAGLFKWHPLQLHCFHGGPEEVRQWLATRRMVYFSVGGAIVSASRTQIEGLQSIPRERLLLETDSPYFPMGVTWPMSPLHIGAVARVVAQLIGLPLPELS